MGGMILIKTALYRNGSLELPPLAAVRLSCCTQPGERRNKRAELYATRVRNIAGVFSSPCTARGLFQPMRSLFTLVLWRSLPSAGAIGLSYSSSVESIALILTFRQLQDFCSFFFFKWMKDTLPWIFYAYVQHRVILSWIYVDLEQFLRYHKFRSKTVTQQDFGYRHLTARTHNSVCNVFVLSLMAITWCELNFSVLYLVPQSPGKLVSVSGKCIRLINFCSDYFVAIKKVCFY